MVERWRQLPLDRALSYAGLVHALVQSLADAVATANGVGPSAVPDLGPATLMDQLTVLVHDASVAAARTVDPVTSTPVTTGLAEDLATLRRELV